MLFVLHVRRSTLHAMIATSQAQSEDAVVTHTCQRQMLRINQREAQNEKKTAHCCNSTNSLHTKLTGEQTAAHDNTPAMTVTIACRHVTCKQRLHPTRAVPFQA